MNFKTFHIALAVLLALLPNEIASQDNVLPSRPGGLLASSGGPVNGHDVGPLDEVVELQPQADEVEGFINGPTGTSVLTEERQHDLEGAANVRYVNGPTSTSVEAEENRQTASGQGAFVGGPEAAPGPPEESQPGQGPFVNGPTGTSVALEEGLRLPEEGRVVVNGPTGISVEAEENQQRLDEDGIVSVSNAQKNRGRISTNPEEAERNLISSSVLSQGKEIDDTPDEVALLSCGVNFCPDTHAANNNTNLEKPPVAQIYTMASIYLACALLSSVIIAVFVDPLTKYGEEDRVGSSTGKSGLELLIATFSHMRHPYQLLIIPLTIWSGVEQAFIGADYTAAYVSCGLGVHMVGYVMICYGVCDAICSVSFSPLVKMIGRVRVFSMGAIINFAIIITLRYWMPHPDDFLVFFAMAALWGVSDAVWQTQINAFYGVIFPGESEAAFSNYRLWESLGFIFAYVGSTTTCVDLKTTNLIISLVFGIVGYYAIEVIERRGGLPKNEEGTVIPADRLLMRKIKGVKE